MTRRGFITDLTGAVAGVAFCSCGLEAAAASAPVHRRAQGRRAITVGGRRVRTIDVHAHCYVPEAAQLLGAAVNATASRGTAPLSDFTERLDRMDAQGIDVQALSINPFWYGVDRGRAREVIALQNERLAALCAAHPDRFVAFATVAMQHPDLAAEQLEHGITKLKLRGVSLGATVNGEELASPRFDPFWAKAEQLGALVFIHPNGVPELQKRLDGNGMLGNVIGNPLETTIALAHLMFEGTLDRFPNLKICAAHGGGYLPAYAGRFDAGCATFPQNCKPGVPTKKPSEYLKQLYYDSLVFTPEALRHLVAECGPGQILLGTDDPYGWTDRAVEHVLDTPGLDDDHRRAILGGTAAALLRI